MLYSLLLKAIRLLGGLATRKQVDDLRVAVDLALRQIRDEQLAQSAALKDILSAVEPLPAVRFVFDVELEGQITPGATQLKITDSQLFTASIQPVDAKNNPAAIDGVPTWASSSPDILTVTPAADGLSAVVTAVGRVGSAQVSVSADADLGEGTKAITGVLQVDVVAGEAVSLNISTSEPTAQ